MSLTLPYCEIGIMGISVLHFKFAICLLITSYNLQLFLNHGSDVNCTAVQIIETFTWALDDRETDESHRFWSVCGRSNRG